MAYSALCFLAEVRRDGFTSSFPIITVGWFTSSVFASSDDLRLIPFPRVAGTSDSSTASTRGLMSFSVGMVSCPSSVGGFTETDPAQPPPVVAAWSVWSPLGVGGCRCLFWRVVGLVV